MTNDHDGACIVFSTCRRGDYHCECTCNGDVFDDGRRGDHGGASIDDGRFCDHGGARIDDGRRGDHGGNSIDDCAF